MNLKPFILLVEDDPAIRRILRSLLKSADYDTEEATNLETGLSMESILHPDIVILDLGLPDGDGIDFIRELRKKSEVPVIVLSARDKETEKVRALESGANDYVTKPFGPAELKARIKVALRQIRPPQHQGKVECGPLQVDLDARRAFLSGNEVHLTALEYKLLFVMVQHPGKILTVKYLLKEVWGYEADEQKHYVRILAASLRKKIEPAPGAYKFVHTEIGMGYRFLE